MSENEKGESSDDEWTTSMSICSSDEIRPDDWRQTPAKNTRQTRTLESREVDVKEPLQEPIWGNCWDKHDGSIAAVISHTAEKDRIARVVSSLALAQTGLLTVLDVIIAEYAIPRSQVQRIYIDVISPFREQESGDRQQSDVVCIPGVHPIVKLGDVRGESFPLNGDVVVMVRQATWVMVGSCVYELTHNWSLNMVWVISFIASLSGSARELAVVSDYNYRMPYFAQEMKDGALNRYSTLTSAELRTVSTLDALIDLYPSALARPETRRVFAAMMTLLHEVPDKHFLVHHYDDDDDDDLPSLAQGLDDSVMEEVD
jgi:hypothetical protein